MFCIYRRRGRFTVENRRVQRSFTQELFIRTSVHQGNKPKEIKRISEKAFPSRLRFISKFLFLLSLCVFIDGFYATRTVYASFDRLCPASRNRKLAKSRRVEKIRFPRMKLSASLSLSPSPLFSLLLPHPPSLFSLLLPLSLLVCNVAVTIIAE